MTRRRLTAHAPHGLLLLAVLLAIFVTRATPRAQAPATAVAITSSGAAARDWDRQLTTLERAGRLRLRSSRADTMVDGRVHDRFDQYVGEARVIGAQMVRQRSADGVVSMFGQLYQDLAIDPAPALSAEAAVGRVTTLVGRAPMPGVPAELVVLPSADGFRLGWLLHAFTGRDFVTIVIDARTGAELSRTSAVHKQAAVGDARGVLADRKKISVSQQGSTYFADDRLRPPSIRTLDLRGDLARTLDLLDGVIPVAASDVASDTDNQWTDGAVVDAHVYIGQVYDYYFKQFNRRGIDNNNRPILSIAHPVRRADIGQYLDDDFVFGLFYVNAFWCGSCANGTGVMVFGEGLPPGLFTIDVDYFAGALDIVAHELTHGLTEYTSDLISGNEPGALNEAFSDIVGIGAEFFFQQSGSGSLRADYVMGEDIVRPLVAGLVRSAANPGQFGDPDHYSRRYTGPDDDGGIHTNLTIVTHAFYLAIEGGTNRTSGRTVQGVGAANRVQIERAFFRAFTSLVPSGASFSIARQATLQAASDLYGSSSAPYRAITDAWDAVGVQ